MPTTIGAGHANFTLNYGLRIEHEDGCAKEDNRITVGFDRTATSPRTAVHRSCCPPERLYRPGISSGGLLYAGENGANDYQGDPPAVKLSPRFGATWAHGSTTLCPRRVRTVLGAVAVHPDGSWNHRLYTTNEMAQSAAESEVPLTSLEDPFPGGLVPPTGSSPRYPHRPWWRRRVHRSEQGRAEGSPVRHRYAASAARPVGRVAGLYGFDGRRHRFRWKHSGADRAQPDRSVQFATRREWQLGCRGPSPVGYQSVLRRGRHG